MYSNETPKGRFPVKNKGINTPNLVTRIVMGDIKISKKTIKSSYVS